MIDEVAVLAETFADKGKPPARLGVTHWSTRFMAQRFGISFASVGPVRHKWGIQPPPGGDVQVLHRTPSSKPKLATWWGST